MKLKSVQEKARDLGVEPGKMKKRELIHAVQKAEGYTPCYGHFGDGCPYADCCFRSDCIKEK